MALFSLPLAAQLGPRIDRLSDELLGVMGSVERLGAADGSAQGGGGNGSGGMALCEQRELLHRLCDLTAELLKLQALSSPRFSASRAYAQIVDDRIAQVLCYPPPPPFPSSPISPVWPK